MKATLPLGSSLLLAAVLAASAAAPQSLRLVTSDQINAPLTYSPNGAILFEIPDAGTFGISPQFVDAESGTWEAPDLTEKFEPAEGAEVSGTLALAWKNGATADFKIKAESGIKDLKMESSWQVNGDSKGFIRVDLLVPPDVARDVEITGAKGTLFSGGKSMDVGAGSPGPIVFTSASTGKKLFEVEGSFVASAVGDAESGIDMRISPETTGDSTISSATELNWTIVFP